MKPMGLALWLGVCSSILLGSPALAETAGTGNSTTATRGVPAGQPVLVDRIEVHIGSEIITTLEMEEAINQVRQRMSQTLRGAELDAKLKEAKQQLLDRLIETKLLLLEARDQKIEIQDSVVEANATKEIETLKAQFPDPEVFAKQLEAEHLTLEELTTQRKQIVRENMQRQRLLQNKLAEFKEGASLSDEQLKAYFNEHPQEFLSPARARVRQMFFGHPDTSLPSEMFNRQDAQARGKAEKALASVRSGRDFGAVAREWSEHKASAEQGGEIGWIEQGDTGLPEFEKAVFERLKVNEVSGVIDSARGFFIIQVEERQKGGPRPYSEVQEAIRQKMQEKKTETLYQEWMQALRKKYGVTYADKS
jgi:foldase protein PrsA